MNLKILCAYIVRNTVCILWKIILSYNTHTHSIGHCLDCKWDNEGHYNNIAEKLNQLMIASLQALINLVLFRQSFLESAMDYSSQIPTGMDIHCFSYITSQISSKTNCIPQFNNQLTSVNLSFLSLLNFTLCFLLLVHVSFHFITFFAKHELVGDMIRLLRLGRPAKPCLSRKE